MSLCSALRVWAAEHGGGFPRNYAEKKQLRAAVLAGVRRREEEPEVAEDEENFEEAGKAVNTAVVRTVVPDNTRAIIQDPAAENISTSSSNFWILAHALKEFVAKEDRLPVCNVQSCVSHCSSTAQVSGVVPDMFSDSERFIKLQNLYREKAGQDADIVLRKVQQVLESLGRQTDSITELEVRRFCREARQLRVQRGCSIASELANFKLPEDPESDALYYLALRAVDQYIAQVPTFDLLKDNSK